MTHQDVAQLNNSLSDLTRTILQKKLMAQQEAERADATRIAQERNAIADRAETDNAQRYKDAMAETKRHNEEVEGLQRDRNIQGIFEAGDKTQQEQAAQTKAQREAAYGTLDKIHTHMQSLVDAGQITPEKATETTKTVLAQFGDALQNHWLATAVRSGAPAYKSAKQAPTETDTLEKKDAAMRLELINKQLLGSEGGMLTPEARQTLEGERNTLLGRNVATEPTDLPALFGTPAPDPGMALAPLGTAQAPAAMTQPEQPAMPKTRAEFDALPSGAKFINPADGKTYTKK